MYTVFFQINYKIPNEFDDIWHCTYLSGGIEYIKLIAFTDPH